MPRHFNTAGPSLIQRLLSRRVRQVIEPILAGEILPMEVLNDDFAFVRDLGLVRPGPQGLEIANPIYREIIPRALTAILELSIVLPRPSYVDTGGRLDVDQLLDDFRTFWIANGEAFLERAPYSEAAAPLVFMAFLHKIANGGGFVDREYAAMPLRCRTVCPVKRPSTRDARSSCGDGDVLTDDVPDGTIPKSCGPTRRSRVKRQTRIACGAILSFELSNSDPDSSSRRPPPKVELRPASG